MIKLAADEAIKVRASAAEALGSQASLSDAGLTCLVKLTDDEDSSMRHSVAYALGRQASLSDAGLGCLIKLADDEDPAVKDSTVYALEQKPLWCCYKLIAKEPALMQKLYTCWLMPVNYQQIVSFYLDNDHLYFYSDSGLQSILLDQPTLFKRAILEAQEAIGIPRVAQIKIIDDASAFSVSSSPDIFFFPSMPSAWPTNCYDTYSINP